MPVDGGGVAATSELVSVPGNLYHLYKVGWLVGHHRMECYRSAILIFDVGGLNEVI